MLLNYLNQTAFPKPLCSLFFSLAALLCTSCVLPEHHSVDSRSVSNTKISVDGSDTMTSLVETLSKSFMHEHPGTTVVMVTSDSSDGIAALLNKKANLAAASRPLTDEEEQLAEARGLRLKKVTIARDAIAIIINAKNNLNELSQPELGRIFAGDIHNWHELGGPEVEVATIIREPSSGTARYFRQHILAEREYGSASQTATSHEDVLKQVSSQIGGIGYVPLVTAQKGGSKVKIVSLKLTDASPSGVTPSKESLVAGYPLSRPLYLISQANPDPLTDKFVSFCLTAPGQKIVSDSGFVPIH